MTAADDAGEPVLVLGGGSNLVVADDGFAGTVVEVATRGVADRRRATAPPAAASMVTVAAGEDWDDLVARAVERGWVGIEALSGIPGSVGATPIQNVGAYGQEVSQTIAQVRVWDRKLQRRPHVRQRRLRLRLPAPAGSRPTPAATSSSTVTFQFTQGDLGAPVAVRRAGRALGVEPGERAPLARRPRGRARLRRGKGMVLDPDDHDTWSAGSFFTNPVVDAADASPRARRAWPQPGRHASRPAPPG